jgi:hypothetical protein
MARFVTEKLPPHWLFVPSKRQIRELLGELHADVRVVEFYGTGYGRSADRLSLGFVESRVAQGGWCFYLRLWGVREEAVGAMRDELAASALSEIRRYIRECASKPAADVSKPTQFILVFCVGLDGISPKCRVKVVDRRSYPTPAWWQSELAIEQAAKEDWSHQTGFLRFTPPKDDSGNLA